MKSNISQQIVKDSYLAALIHTLALFDSQQFIWQPCSFRHQNTETIIHMIYHNLRQKYPKTKI